MILKLTEAKRRVLLQALDAVAWYALHEEHPDRKAAEALVKELTPPKSVRGLEGKRA